MITSKQIQEFLKVNQDGQWGPKTKEAAINRLKEESVDASSWGDKRISLAIQQLIMRQFYKGKIDGLDGPATKAAQEEYQNWFLNSTVTVQEESENLKKNLWPVESDVRQFYGNVGKNQTILALPYPCKISWARKKVITQFSIHEKVKDSAERVLKAVLDHYGLDEIQRLGLDLWSGCLNERMKRGGNTYSMHAWGIAIDWDAEHNEMRWDHRKAKFAQPEYNKWWELWESEGWVSLGRARDFDWMHVQAARLG